MNGYIVMHMAKIHENSHIYTRKKVHDREEEEMQKQMKSRTRRRSCEVRYSTTRKESNAVSTTLVMYKDCRKNHAAKIGRYAVDGCCEFMPAGDAGSPGAFLCAACNCHRNFHRKVIVGGHHHGDVISTSSCDCSSMSTAPK